MPFRKSICERWRLQVFNRHAYQPRPSFNLAEEISPTVYKRLIGEQYNENRDLSCNGNIFLGKAGMPSQTIIDKSFLARCKEVPWIAL